MWQQKARAKVNLCLHVTGARPDGLHDLESLVVFPDIGDDLSFETSATLKLTIDGPFAKALSTENLILAAAQMMGATGHFHLTKKLPIASGIGGGSADAAAAIRLITAALDLPAPNTNALMGLGADIPACLRSEACVMSGAGEGVRAATLPPFGIVLINAGEPVSTAAVFSGLQSKRNSPMDALPMLKTAPVLFEYLRHQRNDLEGPAVKSCPAIADVLRALRDDTTCAIARMSGSGGTCFGLFETADIAKNSAEKLRENHPNWWITSA